MASITMSASLDTLIFYNPDNYYFVAEFRESKTHHYFTATGHLADPLEDQEYELEGQYVTHPRYGKQFQVSMIKKVLPKDNDAIIRFLCGDNFPTIGRKTAEMIVEALGDDCLAQIQENPDILMSIPKLQPKRIEIIAQGIKNFDGFSDTYLRLMNYGLPPAKIALIQSHYDDVDAVLEENCFKPYYEIFGFGYKSACLIADGMDLDPSDQRRLDAFIYERLRQLCMASGDTFITQQTLFQQLSHIDPTTILDVLIRLNDLESVHLEDNRIYPFSLYEDEIIIAKEIINHNFEIAPIDKETLDQAIETIETQTAITYDDIQKEAIETFFTHSMMVLNGGPGTGKTTIIKGILQLCKFFFPSAQVQLCAPTGRAANRMSQLSDNNAKTIHSLLKWNMEDNTFGISEEEPLDCDFLVVDECSMVDTHLFATLLRALPRYCRIILIGDEDQLESVGPGKVLQDILDSNICPTIRLQKIYRQQHGSGIVTLAKEIRNEEKLHYQDGVTFHTLESQAIAPALLELAQNYEVDQIQILAPMYRGVAGIDTINDQMQRVMNPPLPNKAQYKIGTTTFRVDDKVMLLKNMPEQDVFNGDIGYIIDISKRDKEMIITVDFGVKIVEFANDHLYYLKHAYCISVHKSQGCEFDVVCCVIEPNSSHMLNKRLLYTAISRAKKELFLFGNQQLFENRVRLKQRHIRQTTLLHRFNKYKENV